MNNDVMNKLTKKVSGNVLQSVNGTISGYIINVDYEKRKVDVVYNQKNGGKRYLNGISFPSGEDGVFTTSLEEGDMVELTSRNNSTEQLFISNVYRKNNDYDDIECDKGHKMPKMTNFF